MITQPSFIKSTKKSDSFLIPALPFSIWEKDTLVWASDERHAHKLTCEKRSRMAKEDFLLNGKVYTLICDEHHEAHTALLTKMIKTAISGEKDENTIPLLSIYHLCKDFFTNELTTHFDFSERGLNAWVVLERGIPFMLSLLLTVYPILCKNPTADIALHFESTHDVSTVSITPHCTFDFEKDVLHHDFLSTLLCATLKNADFSIAESDNCITLSAKHVSHTIESGVFNANTEIEIQSVFAFFLSLCTQYQEA